MTAEDVAAAVDDAALDAAVAELRRGGLVAFPTETVYGLGADASDPAAVAKVFAVKGRPADHPLIVHIAAAAELDRWAVDVPDAARALARTFWPGPLTLVLRRSEAVSAAATGNRATVGLRVPAHPVALELLRRFGGAIAAPSANRFGRVSPTTAAHVRADLGADVGVVLDGGPSDVGIESTIVDLTDDTIEVLRLGAVTVADLEAALGRPVAVAGADVAPRASGMLEAHYAPRARVVLADDGAEAAAAVRAALTAGAARVAVLAPAVLDGLPPAAVELEPAGGAEHFAAVLYDRLRQADRLDCTTLVVVPPPEDGGIGSAVRDRLRRAAADAR